MPDPEPGTRHPDPAFRIPESSQLSRRAIEKDPGGLAGDVEYAVFTNGDFEANFGGLGYTAFPSLIYTYQLVPRLRGLDITGYNLEITHPANTIGTFGIGDQNASMKWFLPNAEWLFDVGVAGGQTSWGLAFASPQAPHFSDHRRSRREMP